MFPEKEMQFQEAGSDEMNLSRYSPIVNFNLHKALVIHPLLEVHVTSTSIQIVSQISWTIRV